MPLPGILHQYLLKRGAGGGGFGPPSPSALSQNTPPKIGGSCHSGVNVRVNNVSFDLDGSGVLSSDGLVALTHKNHSKTVTHSHSDKKYLYKFEYLPKCNGLSRYENLDYE